MTSVAVPAGLAPSARASPLRGRLDAAASASLNLYDLMDAGFSRASIAVASREMCSIQLGHPSSAQSASHADGWPDRSRSKLGKGPLKTSPRSRSRRGGPLQPLLSGIACRQPQDARSGSARRRNVEHRLKAMKFGGRHVRVRGPTTRFRPHLPVPHDRSDGQPEPRPALIVPEPIDEQLVALRPSRWPSSLSKDGAGTTLARKFVPVIPIASRGRDNGSTPTVVIMRCFATAHCRTHDGGPVPPQGPSIRQKSRSASS